MRKLEFMIDLNEQEILQIMIEKFDHYEKREEGIMNELCKISCSLRYFTHYQRKFYKISDDYKRYQWMLFADGEALNQESLDFYKKILNYVIEHYDHYE